ncbi:MAG: radical SAM family heme chaperone HemW [Microbacteriaceae bacterium]
MAGALPEGDVAPSNGALPDFARASRAPLSAYVHVPFCRVRCGYCDFNTYTGEELQGARRDDFADHVLREIELATSVLDCGRDRELTTVFFGGGTPTLLPARDLLRVLRQLRDDFGLAEDAEVTVEANPDSVDAHYLHKLAEGGVTRVSLGVQSAVPHVLANLDRTHNPERVPEVVGWAKDAGLDVSVDLIYGTPGESLDDWRISIESALALQSGHISAYALIVEEGTALERRIRRGELAPPDDDLVADMYELADDTFSRAGFDWYEVSNWARSARERSRHNTAYWVNHDWWGFGPGAHSHVGGVRWWNVKHPNAYAQRVLAGDSPAAARETPDLEERYLETVLLRLRLAEGLTLNEVSVLAGERAMQLAEEGMLDADALARGTLVLTLRGRLLADYVVRQLTD